MIRPAIIDSCVIKRGLAIGVHHPDRGGAAVVARQKAMGLPSGDSLARKSQTGGSLVVRCVSRPSRGIEPADLRAAARQSRACSRG